MPEKLKILISAYACSPDRGSEPGMAWNIVYELSKYHEIHVITEEFKWKCSIEGKLNQDTDLGKNLKFYFIYKKRNKPLRKIWPPSYYWFYKQWQKKAYDLAKALDKIEKFDVIHQLNMIGYREPGFLWKFRNKPLVWGPVGGFAQMKWSFIKTLAFHDIFYYAGRNIMNSVQMKFSLRVKKMATNASIIISATREAREGLLNFFNRSSYLITETGARIIQGKNIDASRRKLTMIWVGSMEGRKALHLALRALSKIPTSIPIQFLIIGDGPNRIRWEKLTERLGLSTRCKFYGLLPYAETQRLISESSFMIFTSLQEGTPHVVLEALSYGVPVVCHDANGHGSVITDECGIKIKMINPKHSIDGFKEAILILCQNRELLKRLSTGSIARARELSWQNKGLEICRIYERALEMYQATN